jgi:hypothetical protein
LNDHPEKKGVHTILQQHIDIVYGVIRFKVKIVQPHLSHKFGHHRQPKEEGKESHVKWEMQLETYQAASKANIEDYYV